MVIHYAVLNLPLVLKIKGILYLTMWVRSVNRILLGTLNCGVLSWIAYWLFPLVDHLMATSLVARLPWFIWFERLLHYHWRLVFLKIILYLSRHEHFLDLIRDNLFINSQVIQDLDLLAWTIWALVPYNMFIWLRGVINLYFLNVIWHRPHLLHLLGHLRLDLISHQRILLNVGFVCSIDWRNVLWTVVELQDKLLDVILIICYQTCCLEYPWTVWLSLQVLAKRVN